eukprot:jgi/Mesen1/8028/ME000426S07171
MRTCLRNISLHRTSALLLVCCLFIRVCLSFEISKSNFAYPSSQQQVLIEAQHAPAAAGAAEGAGVGAASLRAVLRDEPVQQLEHLSKDTVLDAGNYDGVMGVICAIAAVKALLLTVGAAALSCPVEVVAFSDEEGVRYQSTFLGSTAITGRFPADILHSPDRNGVTMAQALNAVGLEGSKAGIVALQYSPRQVAAYVEVHIEQGPVLEAEDTPLGVVLAIAGQSRLTVTVEGEQGHAGTVPMRLRRDPMAAAAEAIVGIESICNRLGAPRGPSDPEADVSGLVCTVGDVRVWPGASNVIPGQVSYTVDVRARKDPMRNDAVDAIQAHVHELCTKRHVTCTLERKHDAAAVECASDIVSSLKNVAAEAVAGLGLAGSGASTRDVRVPMIISGAGHDAMAMGQLTKVGMLFVRCKGGVSHSPHESVLPDDIYAASAALLLYLQQQATRL